MPAWRRATFGRVVLQVLVGFLMGFVLVVLMVIVLFSAGRSPESLGSANQQVQARLGGAFWILILGAELAWLLFVYLKSSARLRTALMLAILAAAFAGGTALALAAVPRALG
ncbi:MAG: hypothetical protein HY240_04290 [Actinobacteria bacterium]|nr:hypothetical protein [Actinomycetota bacterium]